MQNIIERVQAMVAHKQSQELREYIPTILDKFTGDIRSRLLQHLAIAYERTATTGAEYRKALSLAEEAVSVAEQGGLYHTWALHLVVAYAGDMGQFAKTERAAQQFFELLPNHPKASIVAPWVYYHAGRAFAHHKDIYTALTFLQAVDDSNCELHERALLSIVWTLAGAGRLDAAEKALPDIFHSLDESHRHAALAYIAAKRGRWHDAKRYAVSALTGYREHKWRIYDTAQAAYMFLVLKTAAVHERRFKDASVYAVHAAALLIWYNAGEILQDDFPIEGRCLFEEAASGFGPAGAERMGLLGTVG